MLLSQRVVQTRAPSYVCSRYSHSVHVIGDWMMLVCQGLLLQIWPKGAVWRSAWMLSTVGFDQLYYIHIYIHCSAHKVIDNTNKMDSMYTHTVHWIHKLKMYSLSAKCHLSLLYTSSLLYPGLSCCTPSARHSFCSALLGDSDQSTTMALIGGEGNCFSVVTHHNPHPITVDLKPVL